MIKERDAEWSDSTSPVNLKDEQKHLQKSKKLTTQLRIYTEPATEIPVSPFHF